MAFEPKMGFSGAVRKRFGRPGLRCAARYLGETIALLLSMTGYGAAHFQDGGTTVAVEVRTLNSRYFKLTVRVSEGYSALESRIESVVRQFVRRGTVTAAVEIRRAPSPDDFGINAPVLRQYWLQLESLRGQWGIAEAVPLHALLALPGVVGQASQIVVDVEPVWSIVRPVVHAALERMEQMRRTEGRAMEADLRRNLQTVSEAVAAISRRAPEVVESYRSRLEERVRKMLADLQTQFDPADLIKELSIIAERSDIAEEVVRLRSHLEQFQATIDAEPSDGRKLEFLLQEMYREANTISSKSPDVEIVRQVIEIKAAVERMREMVQNVE